VGYNRSGATDADIEAYTRVITYGLFSVLATLGQVPIIRCASGGPAEMVRIVVVVVASSSPSHHHHHRRIIITIIIVVVVVNRQHDLLLFRVAILSSRAPLSLMLCQLPLCHVLYPDSYHGHPGFVVLTCVLLRSEMWWVL
jgi:hypothetical protein